MPRRAQTIVHLVWITDVLPNDIAGPIGALVEEGARVMKQALERVGATVLGTVMNNRVTMRHAFRPGFGRRPVSCGVKEDA